MSEKNLPQKDRELDELFTLALLNEGIRKALCKVVGARDLEEAAKYVKQFPEKREMLVKLKNKVTLGQWE